MDAGELARRYERYWERGLRMRIRRLLSRRRSRCGDVELPPPEGLAGVPARLHGPRPGAGGAAVEP